MTWKGNSIDTLIMAGEAVVNFVPRLGWKMGESLGSNDKKWPQYVGCGVALLAQVALIDAIPFAGDYLESATMMASTTTRAYKYAIHKE